MFTPRVVLEARDWLRRNNPRQAAAVLLTAHGMVHRDVAAARQEVQSALLRLARAELERGALWGAWEITELAAQLSPLNGEDRAFHEALARQVEQRQARQQSAREVAAQARKWLDEQKVRQAAHLLERYLAQWEGRSASGEVWKLTTLLDQARSQLEALEATLAPIRQAMEKNDLLLVWRLCAAARPLWKGDPELNCLRERAGEALCRQVLEQARAAAQAEALEQGRQQLARARQFAEGAEAVWQSEFAAVEAMLSDIERRRQETAARRQAQALLAELEAAIQQRDLPLALKRLHAAYALVPRDDPQLRSLSDRVHELEQSAATSAQPRPIRERTTSLVLGNEWLVISTEEVIVGGRGSQRATLRISASLPAKYALLVRDRKGYMLQPLATGNGAVGGLRVDGREVGAGLRLEHGSEIAWQGAEGGVWRWAQPVAGSQTATLILQDLDGCPAVTSRGPCRKVLLLAEEAVLAGERGPGVHAVVPRLPGRLRLMWREDGLYWRLEDCLAQGSTEEPATEGIVCVPSELVLQREVSEADWLAGALRGQRPASVFRLGWAWA